VQHGELAAGASGEKSVLDQVKVVQSVLISNPEFGDDVLTQNLGHFPWRSP